MRRLVASALVMMMSAGPGVEGAALGQGGSVAAQPAALTQSAAPGRPLEQTGRTPFRLKVSTNIVLTNVVVRDRKTGELVKGLKASDFRIYENKREQKIISFDYENVDRAATLSEASTAAGKMSVADLLNGNYVANTKELKDHRLIVIFFDLSSMQDEDIDRAVDAAENYVKTQMRPADLVALVSMSTGLTLDQDFTSNKTALLAGLAKYNGIDETGFANGTTGSTSGTADDAGAFAANDTEFNSLNTDRELLAIRAIAQSLEKTAQRKSMLYFSGGLTKNGIENETSLRAATNEAVRANMAIYTVDARGLQALSPLGDATQGSLRGNSAYSGAAATAQFSANYGSQSTLSTLSTETGGKAFFDSNDFAPAFQQIQHDTEAYYILGYRSTNQKMDGSYRHLLVKVDRPDVKLEYRSGYYAQADFQHEKSEDREEALNEQMRSDMPATDVAVYLQALYFMQQRNMYSIPVSLIVPGSQIPFVKGGDRDKAALDIMGQVKDAQGIVVGNVRQTVKLAVNQSQQVRQKNIEYSTSFLLAPGHYHLKFVVREDQTGNMGSFETDIQVPDLRKAPLKMSSVLIASQRVPAKDKHGANPLLRDGLEWVPNVAHVFRQGQHLYFLYEVYDPAREKGVKGDPVRLLTSIEFMDKGTKVYETPLVTAQTVNDPVNDAVVFQFDVPVAQLKPGTYICQVNVIDDAAASFMFPRLALKVEPSPAGASTVAKASGAE
ncbi:MAG: VWA domain-containing protein [Acidobacteriaceae bacterium]